MIQTRGTGASTSRRQALPTEILYEMDGANPSELRSSIKKYNKEVPQYDGGHWTKATTINKTYIQDLKQYQVDAKQAVYQRREDAEK